MNRIIISSKAIDQGFKKAEIIMYSLITTDGYTTQNRNYLSQMTNISCRTYDTILKRFTDQKIITKEPLQDKYHVYQDNIKHNQDYIENYICISDKQLLKLNPSNAYEVIALAYINTALISQSSFIPRPHAIKQLAYWLNSDINTATNVIQSLIIDNKIKLVFPSGYVFA